MPKQVNGWAPELKKLGFEKVNEAKNANTGNRISVYHYAYGQ